MESKNTAQGSISRRLLGIFVVVSVLPLMVAASLSYWSSREVVAELLKENIGKTAQVYSQEVDDFLLEQTALLSALANALQADDEALAEVVRVSAKVKELLIISEGGEVLARSSEEESWAVAACRSQQQAAVAPMTHAHGGHGHEVVVNVPRPDGSSLCGRVSFTLHQEMLSERAHNSFGGLAYIINRQGDVVCHAFEESEPHVHPGQPVGGEAAFYAQAGEPWHGLIVVDGERRLAAYSPSSKLPWGVWAEVPLSEASSVLSSLASRALLIGVVMVLVLGGVIWVVARRIAAPIEALAEASSRLAAGNVGETVQVRGDDEVATLAREFNKMSVALARSVQELDDKVQERTRELEQSRQFSDTLLDTLDQRILVLSADLIILRMNEAAVGAYGDQVGKPYSAVHTDGASEVRQVFSSEQFMATERVYRRQSGPEILAVERYCVRHTSGSRAVLEIERDVTEVKQFQAHSVHQEKMAALGTLAAGLAHEIGNPLASLSSELEMLGLDPSSLEQSLPVLQRQVHRMGDLLSELVQLGRRPKERWHQLDAGLILHDVLSLLRHQASEAGVVLRRSVEEEVVFVSSSDRLVQVLLNLGLNAVDAAQPGGKVRFEVSSVGDTIQLVVEDDGPGIAEEHLEHLFEPFFTTKPVGQGTGLGLFVVHRVVSALQGEVRVETSEWGGARFVVLLPKEPDR